MVRPVRGGGGGGFFKSNRAMFELADELGITDAMSGDDILLPISNEHGLYTFSLRFDPSESARIPGMTDAALKALPHLGAEITRLYADADPSLPWQSASLDNVSVGEFVREIAGAEAAEPILRYALNPVTVGWCGTDVDQASCVPFFSMFAQDGGRYVRPRQSIATLPNKPAEHLDVGLRSVVTNVSPPGTDGRRQVSFMDESGARGVLSPDFVVCALQGTRVKSVVDDLSPVAEAVFGYTNYSKFNKVSYVMREVTTRPLLLTMSLLEGPCRA